MGQPVKLSDKLILSARLGGAAAKRSIAGQIEFWADLGKAVEKLLRGSEVIALQHAGEPESVSRALSRIGTHQGDSALAKVLKALPYPHYEPSVDKPGLLVRIDADGTRTTGRFVNRKFRRSGARRRR
jgi:hypothetical protein